MQPRIARANPATDPATAQGEKHLPFVYEY